MRVSIVSASRLTLARFNFSFRLFHEATLRLLRELSLLPTYSWSCFLLQSTRIWAGVIRRGFISLIWCITVINLSDYAIIHSNSSPKNHDHGNIKSQPTALNRFTRNLICHYLLWSLWNSDFQFIKNAVAIIIQINVVVHTVVIGVKLTSSIVAVIVLEPIA